jgi:CelD/BcsL family acetyltransferase involved in cellulose biosynthesis
VIETGTRVVEGVASDVVSPPRPSQGGVWEIYRWDDAGRLVAPWQALSERRAGTPFAEPFWTQAWWASFAERGERLELHALLGAEGLLAVVPLVARSRAVRLVRGPFNPHVPYVDVTYAGDPLPVARGLLGHLAPRADVIEFGALPEHGAWYRALSQAAQEGGALRFEWEQPGNLLLPLDGGWEALRTRLSRNLLQGTERKARQLEREGALVFERSSSEHDLAQQLRQCYELEQASWKGARGSAIACKPQTQRFYDQVAAETMPRDMLGLYMLHLGGRLIAFEYCLRHRGTIHLLKLSFDESLAACSPGNVLRLKLLKAEAQAGHMRQYDFGIDSAWKRRWTEQRVPLRHLRIYLPHVRGRAAFWLGPGVRGVLKRSAWLARLARRLRGARQSTG